MNKTPLLQISIIILSISAYFSPVFAQNSNGQGNSASTTALAPLYACAQIQDAKERLACFDSVVGTIKAKEASQELVTFDAPKVREMRREAFGFNLPSLPKLGLPKLGRDSTKEDEIERQTMQLERLGRSGGNTTFVMSNGQVWSNVENTEVILPGRLPLGVSIRSASFGSYILSIEGRNRGYSVRRIQ